MWKKKVYTMLLTIGVRTLILNHLVLSGLGSSVNIGSWNGSACSYVKTSLFSYYPNHLSVRSLFELLWNLSITRPAGVEVVPIMAGIQSQRFYSVTKKISSNNAQHGQWAVNWWIYYQCPHEKYGHFCLPWSITTSSFLMVQFCKVARALSVHLLCAERGTHSLSWKILRG